MSKIIAVVASNREHCLQEFLAAWTPPPWDEIIVVEDEPKRSFDLGAAYPICRHHVSWAEMATDADVIDPTPFSRRDAAIKMYGFWVAVRLRADIIIALDDDCFPSGPLGTFTAQHTAALSPRARWVPVVEGSPTRGIPYFDLGTMGGAVANMGLWRGAADYDSIQSLTLHRLGYLNHSYDPKPGNRLVHPHHYWPWSAMNISFRREVLPLMHMPKMGEDSPYRRVDDTWCGIILQRCCRHLGLSLSVGDPHVRHVRASDPLVNLEKEAPGIGATEKFWKVVEETPLDAAKHATPLACAEAVAAQILRVSRCDKPLAQNPTLVDYLAAEGARMQSWCRMFRNAGWK